MKLKICEILRQKEIKDIETRATTLSGAQSALLRWRELNIERRERHTHTQREREKGINTQGEEMSSL